MRFSMSQTNGTALATRTNSPDDSGASYLDLPPLNGGDGDDHAPELAQEVDETRARVHYQGKLVGLRRQELSDGDFEAIEALEKEKREQTRVQELQHFKTELADRDADFKANRKINKHSRRFEIANAKAAATMQQWRRRASYAAERLTSHDMRLAQLVRQLTWTRRLLIALIAIGMAWSAVNVQHNLVPSGDSSQPLFWVSYGVEALVSGCLIVLLMTSATLASWNYSRARNGYALEAGLVTVSLLLNIGTPLSRGDVQLALEYAVAPLMVGALVWTYNYATGQLSKVLAEQAGSDLRQRYADLLADGELLVLAGRGLAALNDGSLRPSTATDGGGVPSASALASGLGVSKPRGCQVRDAMKLLREMADQH